MSMQDQISDMLCRIRNALLRRKQSVQVCKTKINEKILTILLNEGYISSFEVENTKEREFIVYLKYYNSKPVIETIKRVSKPSLRVYKDVKNLPKILNGLGVAIVSTSKGIMTSTQAKKENVGGEVLLYVY